MKKKIIGISICVVINILAIVLFFLRYKDSRYSIVMYLGIIFAVIGIICNIFQEDLLSLEVRWMTNDGTEPSDIRRILSTIGAYLLCLFPVISLIIALCTFK